MAGPLIWQMDDCELQLLVRLLEFLHDYQACQREQGFMTPSLGQVFGPVLLRAHEGPLPLPFPEDTRAATQLVDDMILDFAVIFSHPPPCSSAAHKPPSRLCSHLHTASEGKDRSQCSHLHTASKGKDR